jgi:hypothetical protein
MMGYRGVNRGRVGREENRESRGGGICRSDVATCSMSQPK